MNSALRRFHQDVLLWKHEQIYPGWAFRLLQAFRALKRAGMQALCAFCGSWRASFVSAVLRLSHPGRVRLGGSGQSLHELRGGGGGAAQQLR